MTNNVIPFLLGIFLGGAGRPLLVHAAYLALVVAAFAAGHFVR